MGHWTRLLLLGCLLITAHSLFSDKSAVLSLTAETFKKRVLESDYYWLVYFYAPWCGHCKKSAPEFTQAAEIMKGVVNFGAVDMDQHRAAGEPYGVSSYPTIKLFGRNKNKPKDFVGGERTFDKFVDFTIAAMKEYIKRRTKELAEGAKTETKAGKNTEEKINYKAETETEAPADDVASSYL